MDFIINNKMLCVCLCKSCKNHRKYAYGKMHNPFTVATHKVEWKITTEIIKNMCRLILVFLFRKNEISDKSPFCETKQRNVGQIAAFKILNRSRNSMEIL